MKGEYLMKRLTKLHLPSAVAAAALAVATLGASAAQAQYYAPSPPGYTHHWHHGDRFYGHRDVVDHWDRYRLPPPPRGAYWVHDGPRFVLLGGDGIVIRVWGQ
jgi:hypothetical protein